ncbi:hypothetical protein HB364_01990 [Pseudoflavitalea sp. X16]|uniref:hypothetical protein n=1 Tax=Paraflavitalea devenefica TaxID=2716334 RepID=UPI0014245EC1|nr:hypothetical protein [Paraflavitalea devenefica]NII23833.1 hypothetical protein [Paraflavitalea devenefica]
MKNILLIFIAINGIIFPFCRMAIGQVPDTPAFLKDRGTGIPTSMFSTYINKGEFIIYPFYEYYYDHNFEYKPAELGHSLEQDLRGRYRAHEGLIFIGYGISNRLAVELEAAVISATLYKSKADSSSMPAELKESGLGDVETQIRYRWANESLSRPEIFSYLEIVFPFQKNRKLIGTRDWEFKLGSGLIKGYRWGTVTLRAGIEYDAEEKKAGLGEFAIEYMKRISKTIRVSFIVEGSEDEVSLISDLQFHINKNMFIRINNGFGITSKATDYTPEAGILFHF